MGPECKVFLDVDDLLDIDALEDTVRQSAIIVFFVTKVSQQRTAPRSPRALP